MVDGLYICSHHPGYVPQRVLDKVPWRTVGPPKPIKDAKPFAPRDTYEASEAELFKLIVDHAPVGFFDVTSANMPVPGLASGDVDNSLAADAAAASAIYLYDMIAENERPAIWLATARAKLISLCDWLLTQQIAGPQNSTDSTATQWGAFGTSGAGTSGATGAAGLALLRGYQAIGASKYLNAARACAWFIRTCQCADKRTSSPDAVHRGMWATAATGTTYYAGDLNCLEFLHRFKVALGDEAIGSSATTSDYGSSRAALLSVAIAEARTFWIEGQGGVTGLSSTTPALRYTGSTGLWSGADATNNGAAWAAAVAAFYAVDGATAHVTGLFDWLVSFSSDSSYEVPAVSDVRLVANGRYGAYDAQMCLTKTISTATSKNASDIYDLSTVGILAPLYSTRQTAKLGALKRAIGTPRPVYLNGTDGDGRRLYLNRLGLCGLSFQPGPSPYVDVAKAARLGNMYRYAPKAALGQGYAAAVRAADVAVSAVSPAAGPEYSDVTVTSSGAAVNSGGPISSDSYGLAWEANELLLLVIAQSDGVISTAPTTPGLTWENFGSSGTGGGGTQARLSIYRALPASGGTGNVSVGYGTGGAPGAALPTATMIDVLHVTGMTGGSNGANGVDGIVVGIDGHSVVTLENSDYLLDNAAVIGVCASEYVGGGGAIIDSDGEGTEITNEAVASVLALSIEWTNTPAAENSQTWDLGGAVGAAAAFINVLRATV